MVITRCSAPLSLITPVFATGLLLTACDRPADGVTSNNRPPASAEPLEEVNMTPEPMQIDPAEIVPLVDKGAKVTILGYHQFITSGTPGEMRIMVPKFREQMMALKEAGIPVISLSDYMAWRRGEKSIPERCVVITIDDGYDDLYSEALPIFRELGYPFTFYVYTNFLGGEGRTLADDQVRELIEAGGELGSHSVSHDFLVRAKNTKGDAYGAWLEEELKGSKEALEQRFGVEVTSFAYPYGQYSDEVAELAASFGYTSAVTVNGAKAGYQSQLMELPRYIIYGNHDMNWDRATNFGGGGGLSDSNNLLLPGTGEDGSEKESPLRVWPEDQSVIADRMPTIWADLKKLGPVTPDSIEMKVSGFGKVPATYDPVSSVVSWTATRKLRNTETIVSLSLKRVGAQRSDFARWRFELDRNAYYLPEYASRISAKGAAETAAGDASPKPAQNADDGAVRTALPVE